MDCIGQLDCTSSYLSQRFQNLDLSLNTSSMEDTFSFGGFSQASLPSHNIWEYNPRSRSTSTSDDDSVSSAASFGDSLALEPSQFSPSDDLEYGKESNTFSLNLSPWYNTITCEDEETSSTTTTNKMITTRSSKSDIPKGMINPSQMSLTPLDIQRHLSMVAYMNFVVSEMMKRELLLRAQLSLAMTANVGGVQAQQANISPLTNQFIMVPGRYCDISSSHSKYKTEMCRNFMLRGFCQKGNQCLFAHGMNELRPRYVGFNFRTKVCTAYRSTGFCKYGSRCTYVHSF